MKAAVHKKYGPPEVVQLAEVPKPVPKPGEVLIAVQASTVNRTDAGFRSAEYFVSRFFSGLFRPKHQILGCEFSGIVGEVGANVTRFKVGDKVFGYDDTTFGGHAEFLTTAAHNVESMPNNLTFAEAAALTEGSHYALNLIRASKIKAGEKALVYGATGAIGSSAVQLLKHFGVWVLAVGNTKNVDLLKDLGADKVIDYQTKNFTRTAHRFRLAFDAVGKSSFRQCKPLLTHDGIYVSTELGKHMENIYLSVFGTFSKGKKVIFPIPTMDGEMLQFFKQLAETGEFKPVIDRGYPIDDIVKAYKYVETGQKTGNVILKIV